MKTFRFLDFEVYIKAKEFYRNILKVSDNLKDFSLKDQIRRAALSVILNIAEGSAKKSDKEFYRFLQIALGSVSEVFACLDVMRDNNLISIEMFEKLAIDCENIAKQLGGFSKSLIVKC
ncbi:MAG: four helix bundle protein [Patescibacteria group bacterium]|jgi:four helix bundle protein